MEFYNLTTDTAYLQTGQAEFFDHSPWEMTSNPFERRLAMNLRLGSVIEAIDIATLGRVLGTATRLRRQGITIDLAFTAEAPEQVTATIVGIYSYYVAPSSVDSAVNFELALTETSKSRLLFIVSVTPENKFWVHSEQALSPGENDWAEIMRSGHSSISF